MIKKNPEHNAAEDLNCIVELLEHALKQGHRWLSSISTNDWRSRRYGPVKRHSQAITPNDGKPPIKILKTTEVSIIQNTVSNGQGERECNILVCPDPPSDKHSQGFVALLKIVPHSNFDQVKHINFNIWFHGISNASHEDQIFGWRFEGPEGGLTSHNLYHAQPIKGFKRQEPFNGFIEWIPDTFPTIPVAAKTQLQLAFAVLLTLGGKEFLRKIIQNAVNEKLRDEARSYWGSIYAGEALSA